MDTRKVTVVAAIVIIALLAVGIGYAYVAYTSNSGNQTDVSFIKVTQVGQDTTPYTFADNIVLKYNTYNEDNENKMYYQFPDSTELSIGSGTDVTNYLCAPLGTITFHIVFEGSTASHAPTPLALTVSSSQNFNAGGDWAYFITNENHSKVIAYKDTNTTDQPSAWTLVNPLSIAKDVNNTYPNTTVCVYYGYKAIDDEDHCVDLGATDGKYYLASPPQKLQSGKVVFKVTSSEATVTYNSNNDQDPKTHSIKADIGASYTLLTTAPANFTIPDGKKLKGWNTDKNATDVLDGTQTITGDITYYAIWEDKNNS